jgi:glutathione S-transferase
MNYRETGAGNLRAGNLAARHARGVNVAGVSRIYHIATRADWEQAQAAGEYTRSSVDKTLAEEGFIHASTAQQVAPVANMFYHGRPDLVLLVLDTGRVRPQIRFEPVPGWDDPFPHIYGPLNTDAVAATRGLEPDAHGRFHFAVARD